MRLVLTRVYGRRAAREEIPKFLDAIRSLKMSNFGNLVTLGNTMDEWKDEIMSNPSSSDRHDAGKFHESGPV